MKYLRKKPQKRIAIQFYGYLRSYKDCRDSFFKHLVEPIQKAGYEVDIFMHSWDFVEGQVTSWDYEKAKTNAKPPQKTPPKDELTKLYNLKGIAITAQVQSADDEKFLAIRYSFKYRYKSLANAYFSVYSANQLRLNYEAQNGAKYDFVIVTRPDLFWHKPFSLYFLGDGSLWGRNFKSKLFGFYSVMEGEQAGLDLLYMANPCIINKIANIYPMLDYKKLNDANLFNPESVLQNFMLDNRVELLNINAWSAPFEIKRTDEYWALREQETPEIITISRKEFDRLKRLEHLGGFVRYYTNKKLAILRKNTRAIRYPIKRIFGFKTDKIKGGGCKMFNYIVREKCAVTDEAGFEPLFSYDFPLFCGCTNLPQSEDVIAKLDFVIANPSGVVQLKNLIPLDLLYQNGHDSGAVGALWSSHHAEFADFVMSFSPKNVLEIGGGHSKLALNCLAKNPNLNYTIIEPNPTKHERINYIEKFFGETTLPQKYDCIAHSHLFEHIYNPNEFLGKIYENLCDDLCGGAQTRESKARLIFSLPNMQKWLSNKFTNTLNYEHTIFLNEAVIEYLLHKNGFKILQKRYFKEHSIFFACEKVINRACVSESQITLKSQYTQNKAMIGEFLDFYRRKILDLNAILESTTKPVYLFGAHLFSQFLLYNGLQSAKIISILDNNKAKQGKRLYGTRFLVQSPQILHDKNALLILNAGAYTTEIKQDILENINARTEIVG